MPGAGLPASGGAGTGDMLAANNLSDVSSVATAATNLGLGTGSSPQFTAVNIGHATDTTVTKTAAGKIAVEGKAVPLMAGAIDAVFTGPTAAVKTYTLPDADSTILVASGALGTPASGTLTNCGSLPVSGITASTSTALGVGSIELGHGSDTTITRTGSGAIAVEGVAVLLSGGALGTPSSGTLTNATGLPTTGLAAPASVASPAANTLTLSQGSRGGTDSDVGGGDATLRPGAGTGTGTHASVIIQGVVNGGTATTQQTYADMVKVEGNKLGFYAHNTTLQNPSISDAVGGATVDNEARSAINSLLGAMRNLGLIAT